MSKRAKMLRLSVVLVLLFGLSVGGVYAVLAHWSRSKKRPDPSVKAGQGKHLPKTGQVRVKKTDTPTNSTPVDSRKPTEPPKKAPVGPPPTPQQVVQEAIKIHFGEEVRITKMSLDKGVLTLQGAITKHRQIQDAREVAVSALEEAGFGPIPEEKVINLLRKPARE